MGEIIKLKWRRPDLSEFPKVWHTFKAKDIDSDELVEYRIQDLPESRKEEVVKLMVHDFSKDEPLYSAYGFFNDPDAFDDFTLIYRSILDQNLVLVCFKEGSDEIVGLNMTFVPLKDDNFLGEICKKNKSVNNKSLFDMVFLLYKDIDIFELYGVDKYLSSFGLYVVQKYRGRGVGEQLLRTRKAFCAAFDIKITSNGFSSNFSNRIADNVGFKLINSLRYTDVRNDHPEIKLPSDIQSDCITVKSIVF